MQKIYTIFILILFSKSILFGQGVDSISGKKENKTVKILGIAIPSAMIVYGIISLEDNAIRNIDFNVQNSLEKNNRFWHVKADDYIQFTPTVAAYTLKLCKVESKHNFLDMTILYGLSNVLAGSVIQGAKYISYRERPDNDNDRSFPSGHTGIAFVSAEFLYQEYKDKSIWIGIGGYGVATFVGVARVYNNRHWVSDVVAGAGIGILSTKAVYWVYPYLQDIFGKKDQQLNTVILPGYSNGNFSLALSHTF